MNFFDRHKALIITTLLFAIILLAMYNINIASSNANIRETLIELNTAPPEQAETPKELEERQKTPSQRKTPTLKTHQAFNQDQQESQSELDNRLKEIFKKNSTRQESNQTPTDSRESGDASLNNQKPKQKPSEGDGSGQEISTQKGTTRNSSIAYSLLGRSVITIPNPVYTCDTAGKIVINIVVNASGEVVQTSFNEASSSSDHACLVEKGLTYAKGARFTSLPGRDSQPGTITYYFQD